MALILRTWILLSLLAALASAQQIPVRLMPGTPKGLLILFEDSTGRLWMGSRNGAHYFDGENSYSLAAAGLAENALIIQIAESKDRSIWFASNRGLYRFSEGRVELITPKVTQSILALSDGRMLASIGSGNLATTENVAVTRISKSGKEEAGRGQSGWTLEPLLQLNSEGWLTLDNKDNVLFACPPGWCEAPRRDFEIWKGGKGPIQPLRHDSLPSDVSYTQVHRDPGGCTWTGTEGFVNYICPGEKRMTTLPTSVASSGGRLAFHHTGEVAILSISRLAIGRPGNFRVYNPPNGIPTAIAALFGRDGTLWFAGEAGLYQLKYPGRTEHWTERDGLLPVTSVVRFPKSGKTFAGAVGGMLELSGDRRTWSVWPQSEIYRRIEGIQAAPDGVSILAGLPYRGAAIFSQDSKLLAITRDGKPSAWHFATASDGQVWSSGNALGRLLRNGRDLKIERVALPGRENANALDIQFEEGRGILWACYSGGLIRQNGKAWERITMADGLVQNDCRSIAALSNGDVWYGYSTVPGFSLVRPGTKLEVKHYYSGPRIGQGQVHFLDKDSRGWLWRGASDGVHVATPEMAEAGVWHELGQLDGLPIADMNQQGFYEDPDGSVWFSGETSLVHFDPPRDFLEPETPLKVYFSAISEGDGTSRPLFSAAGESVKPGTSLRIQLGSSRARLRSSIQVRYRYASPAKVADSAWRDSASLNLDIADPVWGENVVEVQARSHPLAPWSETMRQGFSVGTPLWGRWYVVMPGIGVPLCGWVWLQRRRRYRDLSVLPDLSEYRLAALIPEANNVLGTVLDGRFRVLQLIARGGFATVLRGEDLNEKPPKPVAIKVFRPEVDPDWMSKRVTEEIRALAKIDHPNVVRFLAHGSTSAGTPYIAMEFVEGQTLSARLQDDAELDAARSADLLEQLASALDAIHSLGIFHRDLKPDNIMLRSTAKPMAAASELVLIDFSIAIVKEPDQSFHGLSRAAGTYVYMAPEQTAGYACEASDLYSYAKIALEILFRKSVAEILPNAALNLPARAEEFLKQQRRYALSDEAIGIFVRAFEFDPRNRPAGARAFIAPVVRCLRGAGH